MMIMMRMRTMMMMVVVMINHETQLGLFAEIIRTHSDYLISQRAGSTCDKCATLRVHFSMDLV